MKQCTRLSLQLTQQVCIWFGTKLGWEFPEMKTALHQCFTAQRLSDPRIYHWMNEFRSGCAQIVDLQRAPKRKSGHSRANIRRVEDLVTEDRRITLPRLHAQTGISITSLYRILTKDLGLSKRCAKYTPYVLTDYHVQRRNVICGFWTRLRINTPRVFKVAVTMDESWVYCYDPESKEQSWEWLQSNENRPQKACRTLATGKVMLVSFFDCEGLIYCEFMRQPRTITQLVFRQIITRFDIACENHRPRGTVRGWRFLHMDNAPTHTAALTLQHLHNLGWTVLPHPAYSPDLAPSDFWFFPRLKRGLKGRHFGTLQELEDAVDTEVGQITHQKYRECMLQKWPSQWARCQAQQGNFFEGIH